VADPPHIARLKGVVYVLENFMKSSDEPMYSKLGFIMGIVTDELAEELKDLDELTTRRFMFQIGEVIAWIGHGDNSRLPEAMVPFAEMVQPSGHADSGADTPIGIGAESG
jgi:hypothetical protein